MKPSVNKHLGLKYFTLRILIAIVVLVGDFPDSLTLPSSAIAAPPVLTAENQARYLNFLLRQIRCLRARPNIAATQPDTPDRNDAEATVARQLNAIYALRAFGLSQPMVALELQRLISESQEPGVSFEALFALTELAAHAQDFLRSPEAHGPRAREARRPYERFVAITQETLIALAGNTEALTEAIRSGNQSRAYLQLAALEWLYPFSDKTLVRDDLMRLEAWSRANLAPGSVFAHQFQQVIQYTLARERHRPFEPKVTSNGYQESLFYRLFQRPQGARPWSDTERMNAVVEASCRVSMLH